MEILRKFTTTISWPARKAGAAISRLTAWVRIPRVQRQRKHEDWVSAAEWTAAFRSVVADNRAVALSLVAFVKREVETDHPDVCQRALPALSAALYVQERSLGLGGRVDVPREPTTAPDEEPDQDDKLTLNVSALFIAKLYQLLMPPEQLAVITGPPIGPNAYCVDQADLVDAATASRAHVDPDPASIYERLSHFSRFGLALRAFAHSHPGQGAAATIPSETDIKTLDSLRRAGYRAVGIIVADGGWMRFFEAAGLADVNIMGKGVSRHGEKGQDFLFRIDDPSGLAGADGGRERAGATSRVGTVRIG